MKRRALQCLVLVVAAAVVFWVSACVFLKEQTPNDTTHNVVIHKHKILIPGTEISKADHDAMNRILRQYDKALYRVQTYENGQLKRTQGTLKDVLTDKTLASEIAINVKKKGFTQDAMRIGAASETDPTPGGGSTPLKPKKPEDPYPSASPTPDGGATTPLSPKKRNLISGSGPTPLHSQNVSKSQELVDRLKPILEKYSR